MGHKVRLIIVDFVLHLDEPPIGDEPVVHLKYMPAYILIRLLQTRVSTSEGLDTSVIPIEPTMTTYQIKIQQ